MTAPAAAPTPTPTATPTTQPGGKPKLSKVSLSRRRVRPARKGGAYAKQRRKRTGTTLTFTASAAGTLKLTVAKRPRGKPAACRSRAASACAADRQARSCAVAPPSVARTRRPRTRAVPLSINAMNSNSASMDPPAFASKKAGS